MPQKINEFNKLKSGSNILILEEIYKKVKKSKIISKNKKIVKNLNKL
jgi:hypothetical protein